MKKVVILVLLISLFATGAFADNMMVHISALCYDLNHVGYNWAGNFMIGDIQVRDGDVIDLYPGKYTFYAAMGEYDSTPDIGYAENVYNITDSRLRKGFTAEQIVQVYEDKGSYANYWCEWYIEYEFIPIGDAYYLTW